MDADDACSNRFPPEAFDANADQTRLAVRELRSLMAALEAKVRSSTGSARLPQGLAALLEALEALGRKIERLGAEDQSRDQAIAQRVDALAEQLEQRTAELAAAGLNHEARLSARLDAAVAALAASSVGRDDPWPIRAVLVVASAAAAISVMAAAAIAVSQPKWVHSALDRSRAFLADLPLRPGLKPNWAPQRPTLRATAPLQPIPTAPGASTERFEDVVQALERGEATALPRLTGLAQAGEGRAQLQLAGLYESGGAGLTRDMAAARLWTRRAAEGGQRIAMHNLALFLTQGEGGGRDYSEAAQWFRRAADQGVVDSQYNLGLLFEAGRGVDRNLREAYRWFSIAANAGDLLAREKAVALEVSLKPAERVALDLSASAFQPGVASAGDPALIIPPATTLAETQALLVRQGYYLGPIDGVASPLLRMAAAAYLRDHPRDQAKAAAPAN